MPLRARCIWDMFLVPLPSACSLSRFSIQASRSAISPPRRTGPAREALRGNKWRVLASGQQKAARQTLADRGGIIALGGARGNSARRQEPAYRGKGIFLIAAAERSGGRKPRTVRSGEAGSEPKKTR